MLWTGLLEYHGLRETQRQLAIGPSAAHLRPPARSSLVHTSYRSESSWPTAHRHRVLAHGRRRRGLAARRHRDAACRDVALHHHPAALVVLRHRRVGLARRPAAATARLLRPAAATARLRRRAACVAHRRRPAALAARRRRLAALAPRRHHPAVAATARLRRPAVAATAHRRRPAAAATALRRRRRRRPRRRARRRRRRPTAAGKRG